jgi:hypothetical protein
LRDYIKEVEMARVCGMYERNEMHTGLWWGNLKESNCLEDLGIDGRITLKWVLSTVQGMEGHVLEACGSG